MNRRQLLRSAPVAALSAALAAGNVNEAVALCFADPADPIIDLCDTYVRAWEEWEVETNNDPEGNFETPRLLELEAIKNDMQARIKETPILSDAGCAAFWRYFYRENFLRDETQEYPDVHRWQLLKLQDWLMTRAA